MPCKLRLPLAWFTLLLIYLAVCGEVSVSELLAGSLTAGATLWLLWPLRSSYRLALHFKLAWLGLLWRIPPAMIQESWLLLRALLRQLSGKPTDGVLIEQPLPQDAEARGMARSAFMTFCVCITPNSYLVDEDLPGKRVVIRQLAGKELSKVDRFFVELP